MPIDIRARSRACGLLVCLGIAAAVLPSTSASGDVARSTLERPHPGAGQAPGPTTSRLDPFRAAPPDASVVAVGDVTGDGLNDIVTGRVLPGDATGTKGELRVRVGRPDGTPTVSVT